MVELKQLPDGIEPENFAKGMAQRSRVAYLGVASVNDRPSICFDNSEEEYGTMYIDLEDFRQIIDREFSKQEEINPKLIGRLKMRYGIQGLVEVKPDTPVYESHGKYFIEAGLVRVPFSAKSLAEIEFI